MTSSPTISPPGPRRSLLRRGSGARGAASGLEGNALALMISTASTGLLGLVFWTVAARGFPAAEVGRASAVISSATMLASLATLSLGGMFERFLPLTGHRTRSLIVAGYTVTSIAAVLFGAGFLVLGSQSVLHGTAEHVMFPAFVVILTMFGLQDFVLTGLRGARWVAVKNVSYAVVKLAAVALLAASGSATAIVLGWMIPALVGLLVINAVLFTRGLRGITGEPDLPPVRELRVYFGVTYLTSAVATATPLLLPLIVIGLLGAEANAVFNLVWTLTSGCVLLVGATTGAFVVEAVRDRAALRSLIRRFVRILALVAAAGMAVLILAAPVYLEIVGPEYAEFGPALARVLALALPATAVLMLYNSLARVLGRLKMLVVVQLVTASLVIGLSFPAVHAWGMVGVGWSFLIGESVAALVASVPLYRMLRSLRTDS
ncbi:lipopolysaccharide biosynthesis protein [Nakamurella sp. YIM 132087]|uniref:Lipopolysaccharide biosynthesis protein n=1 Tax=Nakamurella alba TaxID=2665158 RepID=A0A7K1FL71_9ACTN|nr:polysaccharide biosynthesis C-terminal domain-containing protein [Nakamurella alba]MTD14891.1 lipopolysaccharide biosynthesis protein [Nakamurella alba]